MQMIDLLLNFMQAPLSEIDAVLIDSPFRGFEPPSEPDSFIIVFGDGTWVLLFVWLIDTSTVV
jgi:hypothetical protein